MNRKKQKLNIALIQMASSQDKTRNIRTALKMCMKAVSRGAKFVLFPETFSYRVNKDFIEQAESIPGSALLPFMEISLRHKVWILAGSVYEKVPGRNKVYNTSALIGDDGRIKALYRKMHLFSIALKTKKISESKICLYGKRPVIALVEDIKTGLSICYDLRFPELYRRYSSAGAKMLCVPSSFTFATGKAHWEVLLKARAIENQCFVLAPNQCGTGLGGIKTYGNSMVVDPWGNILARAPGDAEKIVYAQLDFSRLDRMRKNLPVL